MQHARAIEPPVPLVPVFSHAVTVWAPPAAVLRALVDPRALAYWWGVSRSIVAAQRGGVYVVQWEHCAYRDQALAPLGGVLYGTVTEFEPKQRLYLSNVYWAPPDGAPLGPTELLVTCTLRESSPLRDAGPVRGGIAALGTIVRVLQKGFGAGERWQHYRELVASTWPPALDALKQYAETLQDRSPGELQRELRILSPAVIRGYGHWQVESLSEPPMTESTEPGEADHLAMCSESPDVMAAGEAEPKVG